MAVNFNPKFNFSDFDDDDSPMYSNKRPLSSIITEKKEHGLITPVTPATSTLGINISGINNNNNNSGNNNNNNNNNNKPKTTDDDKKHGKKKIPRRTDLELPIDDLPIEKKMPIGHGAGQNDASDLTIIFLKNMYAAMKE